MIDIICTELLQVIIRTQNTTGSAAANCTYLSCWNLKKRKKRLSSFLARNKISYATFWSRSNQRQILIWKGKKKKKMKPWMQEVKQWMCSYILCKRAVAVSGQSLKSNWPFCAARLKKKKKKNPKQKSQDAWEWWILSVTKTYHGVRDNFPLLEWQQISALNRRGEEKKKKKPCPCSAM